MSVDAILGLQWGDEGKGKLVDLLTGNYDAIVRYAGGDNAGHTVVRDGLTLKFHLLPSGIATPGRLSVIGNGVVVNMVRLCEEIETLEKNGFGAENLRISDRAFVVLPTHRREDQSREAGDSPIGTTGRGIGPAYQDKYGRSGIRMGDFLDGDVAGRLSAKGLSGDEVAEQLRLFERLRPFVCDTVSLLQKMESDGASILLEGAQGAMLDIDFGTYPYVTSSSPTTAGGFNGTGLNPRALRRVIGVMKAYTTRVGHGPFPTELTDELGERIRERGREFGTTTGRARRCGWIDLVQLRYSTRLCGVTDLAIMKLDVLTGIEPIRAARDYVLDGRRVESYPARLSQLERVVTEYEDRPGWKNSITGCREWSALPAEARDYLGYVESNIGCPIRYVSTSPEQKDTIVIA